MPVPSHDGVARTLTIPWLDAAVRCYDTGTEVLSSKFLLLLVTMPVVRGFKVALNYVERNIAAARAFMHALCVRSSTSHSSPRAIAYVAGISTQYVCITAPQSAPRICYSIPYRVA